MNKISKEFLKIAKSLYLMQCNNMHIADLDIQLNIQNNKQLEDVISNLDGEQILTLLMLGKIKDLDNLMQPLKKINELNELYDKFMKFFKQVYDSFPKQALDKAKDMNEADLKKQIKEDKTLQNVSEQFNKSLDVIKNDVKNITINNSWENIFEGWNGIKS